MKKKFIFGFLLAGSLMCCNSVAFASTVDLSVYKFSYDNNDFLKEATPNFNLWNGDEVSLTLYKLDSSLVGTTPLNHIAKDIDNGEKEKYKAVLVKGNETLKNGKANFHVEDKGVYALVETKHPSDTKYWSRTMVFELKGNESPTQSIYLKNQGNTTGTTPLPSLNPVTPNNGSSTGDKGNNNNDNQTDNTNSNTDNPDEYGNKTLPDGTTVSPDGTKTLPDGTKVLPNGDVTLPDGTTIHHDGTVTDKNGHLITPTIDEHNNRVLPNGVMIKQNGDIVFPDGVVIHHNGTITGGTKTQSNNNSSNAASKDNTPLHKFVEKLKNARFPQTGDTIVGFVLGVLMSSGLLWAWLLRKRRKENPEN